MKKAIIIGVTTKDDQYDIDYSMKELTSLCDTAEIEVAYEIRQKLASPNSAFYVGKGKVTEIKNAISAVNADVVVFNDELSPAQLRNLTDELEIEIIDRSLLILNIFLSRAGTREAKLEINLAKLLYTLPRVSSLREKESRSGGTSGALSSKGAGETQAELDKRHIEQQIIKIRSELEQCKTMKKQQILKRKRNELPIVALVGYTNAGKSSTMNSIIDYVAKDSSKAVLAKDELFATLNTFNRHIEYKKTDFILVDTIGFVSKLPHHLVESFNQTLEEIKHADLILHVIDAHSPYAMMQAGITASVIESLGCGTKKVLYVMNKYDLVDENTNKLMAPFYVNISNKTGYNIGTLLDTIINEIKPDRYSCELLVPFTDGKTINFIETHAIIKTKIYEDKGIFYSIEINQKLYSEVAMYEIGNTIC